MGSEIFRFAIVRSPQLFSRNTILENTLTLSFEESELFDALRKARENDKRKEMFEIARSYIKSAKFIDATKKVDAKFIEFADAINNNKSNNYETSIKADFQRIFSIEAAEYITNPLFIKTNKALSESIIAAAIAFDISPKKRSLLISLAKTLKIIESLAKKIAIKKNHLSTLKILLPEDIFPIPNTKSNLKEKDKETKRQRKSFIEEREKKIQGMVKEIQECDSAINEILNVFDEDADEDGEAEVSTKDKKNSFIIGKKELDKLSAPTRAIIKKVVSTSDEIEVSDLINSLEDEMSHVTQKIYNEPGGTDEIARINDIYFPATDLSDIAILETGTQNENSEDENTNVSTEGRHDVRVFGIADLLIVEQDLKRYELGEIAHIENVLKSELRDRKHRITKSTEEAITTETEVTDFKEKDLSSTERYELQTEAQKTINESTSTSAGVTINASYGTVDATSNFNYSNNNSLSESQRSAANFARDITARTVSKLEKRTLERRFQRTVQETEEINQHTFDNKTGTDNITGVYRFVNKIYNAQIVNYGKRLMLEFMIPEPAAFLRYAMTKQPIDKNVVKPIKPGHQTPNGKFIPLKAEDITRINYLFWASKYNVEDITPPPPRHKIIGKSFSKDGKDLLKQQGGNDWLYWHAENSMIDIDNGYNPKKAKVRVDFAKIDVADIENEEADQRITVQIENKQIIYHANESSNFLSRLIPFLNTKTNLGIYNLKNCNTNGLPITISSVSVLAFGINITVLCTLSNEKFKGWQVKTFTAIMNAYRDQRSRYDNANEAARIRAGFTQTIGSSPFMNRETEKTELKRGCLSLLTGENFFDAFDAVKRNAGRKGYPEIDTDDAADEGKYTSFFEQSFEWNNMTYIFYPYFWANKKEWVALSQLNDDDVLFTRFLQAGSCRVILPVRIGFETGIMNYLDSGIIWLGEGDLVNSDSGEPNPLHISVVEELKSQLNNMNIEGIGKLNVTKDSKSVVGMGTEFTTDDENKRIVIAGNTYIIKQVESPTQILLATNYLDNTDAGLNYSFGAKLIGEPWEVKLPTNLVKLDNDYYVSN